MKEEIIQRVIEKIDLTEEVSDDVVRAKIRQVVLEETRDAYLSLNKKEQICNEIFYSLRGLDILQDMLEDDSVTEIMINGYDKIFIEREGRLYRTKEKFSSKKKLEQVIQRIVAKTNRIVNESSPIVDARLSDGSRVHVVLEPISLDGSIMTIRKFSKEITSLEQLLYYGSLNKELMEFLSIMVRAHMNIFISGGTGAGKTTILNLLPRFFPIDEGEITVDGYPVERIRRDSLRGSMAIVLQDTHLFTGTVRENIRFGRLEATDEQVEQAARLTSAHSFIRRLPQGYDTLLENDGANLSQGQRQLLNIARAAVADPSILLLDEATSSIDTRSEILIQQGLDRLMRGRTCLIIAHRLSTVRNADWILVLDEGRIVEEGTHADLLARRGRYYALYCEQFGPEPFSAC